MKSPSKPKPNDLHHEMKPLLYFGQLTFVIPHGKSDYPLFSVEHQIGPSTILQLLNILLICWSCLTVCFGMMDLVAVGSGEKFGVMGYVSNSQDLLTSLMEVFILIYFLLKSRKFYGIFERWSNLNQTFRLQHDKWLRPLASVLIFCPLIQLGFTCLFHYDNVKNAQLDLIAEREKQVKKINGSGKVELFAEDYSLTRLFYDGTLSSWKDVFPYNSALVVIIFLLKLLKSVSWYYVPTLLIFFSRAMAFQYKALIAEATGGTVAEAHFVDLKNKDKIFWINIVRKHQSLSLIVKTINSFLSPITFMWVSMYIYITAIELFGALFLVERGGAITSSHISAILFLVETLQFTIPLISAAMVNKYAAKILNVLRNCPREHYHDTDVCRLEHHISIGPKIGFTGLGCFSITRQFLIKVFNAVFAMEIVLLQSAETAEKSTVK